MTTAPTRKPPRQKPNGISAAVGQRIAYWRGRHQLSGGDLAVEMRNLGHGMYHSTISEIEAGNRHITLDELASFAQVLDLTPVQLLTGPTCESCWDAPPPRLACQDCGAKG